MKQFNAPPSLLFSSLLFCFCNMYASGYIFVWGKSLIRGFLWAILEILAVWGMHKLLVKTTLRRGERKVRRIEECTLYISIMDDNDSIQFYYHCIKNDISVTSILWDVANIIEEMCWLLRFISWLNSIIICVIFYFWSFVVFVIENYN